MVHVRVIMAIMVETKRRMGLLIIVEMEKGARKDNEV